MASEEALRKVVVDTYALLAMALDVVGGRALGVLRGIRDRRIVGLLPVTVAYEYVVHWLRGRVPALKSLGEVETYLKAYFKVVDLGLEDWFEAALIKHRGDSILRASGDPKLAGRRISIVDSTVIALALREGAPVVTGDKDLSYVAKAMGLEVIWD